MTKKIKYRLMLPFVYSLTFFFIFLLTTHNPPNVHHKMHTEMSSSSS